MVLAQHCRWDHSIFAITLSLIPFFLFFVNFCFSDTFFFAHCKQWNNNHQMLTMTKCYTNVDVRNIFKLFLAYFWYHRIYTHLVCVALNWFLFCLFVGFLYINEKLCTCSLIDNNRIRKPKLLKELFCYFYLFKKIKWNWPISK